MTSYAPDGDGLYGSDPLLEETGPIAIHPIGAEPTAELVIGDTVPYCTFCLVPPEDCVCLTEKPRPCDGGVR